MMAILLLVLSLPTPTDGEVRLADADRFGMSGQTARYLWYVAKNHADVMRPRLQGWNTTERLCEWEADCSYRARVYCLLDDVLYCDLAVDAKLRSLRALKTMLGERDFACGRLPSPTPQYRPWSD